MKVRTRIVKILSGTCKAALSTMGSSSTSAGGASTNPPSSSSSSSSSQHQQVYAKVRDLVTTSPMRAAMAICCDADTILKGIHAITPGSSSVGVDKVGKEEVAALVGFAGQLRDLSRKL